MSELVGVFPPSLDHDPVRRALDCLQEGFQIIGYDWHYVYLNPAAARHGRRPAEELIGHSIFEEYPGIDQTPMFATAAALDGGSAPAGLRDRVHVPGRQHAMVRVAGATCPRRDLRVLVGHRPAKAAAGRHARGSGAASAAHVAVYTGARADAVGRQIAADEERHMEIDRRAFITTLGGTTAAGLMSDEAKADALEEFMSARLNETVAMQQAPRPLQTSRRRRSSRHRSRRGRRGAASETCSSRARATSSGSIRCRRHRDSWTSSRCGSTGPRTTACRVRPRRCGRG